MQEIRIVEKQRCLMRLQEQISLSETGRGVTVEKKEGKMKSVASQAEEAVLADLPGIYSLSPLYIRGSSFKKFSVRRKAGRYY